MAYDQRDSGASVTPPGPYGIPDLAADCAALIRGLGYERAHVFGSSYGGFIALQVAVSVPDVVQSLTVCTRRCGGSCSVRSGTGSGISLCTSPSPTCPVRPMPEPSGSIPCTAIPGTWPASPGSRTGQSVS
ncbi:alpha/beta fold hydrolase [Amycolatopsis balhimycina]|uniref:alpha/beta fold hydrolase n=1 Tax=Amycolatopsis balhimycina TaxID=208443 RepID=UPI001FDF0A14|nr:alpha/beta hydrolase [Amycolatopsis balhimycina]